MVYDRARGWLSRFRGVVSATVTPFDDAGRVDEAGIERLVELQVSAGVGALMVGGTTGEYVAMDDAERRRTVERFVACAGGRVPVIAHAGHVDPLRARALTEHALAAGAAAVSAMTPYFFPVTVRAAERYFRDLARLAPDIAFLVYNFPRNATNPFPAEAFEQLLDEPNVAGAKCSVDGMEELEPYLRFEPAVTILCGNDGILPEFVARGGRAIVSGNAAAYPELMVRSFQRLLDGTWAADDAALVADIVSAGRGGAPDRLKALLRSRGIDAGSARIRTCVDDDVAADGNDEARTRVEQILFEEGT